MPSFTWVGKSAVENHDKQVPYRLLKCDPARSHGDPAAGNLLVQGDNLEALKALLPYYRGQVKCVYIDPPYNTGNEGWVYNDNVNSPEIRRWLGKVVGKDADDLNRHDKWLCMMYPRLRLLKEFLHPAGTIFVSIGDNEAHHLRIMMDEIFKSRNFVADAIWQARRSVSNDTLMSLSHNYTICYAADRPRLEVVDGVFKIPTDISGFHNPDNDPRGAWTADPFDAPNVRVNLTYAIVNPNTGKSYLPPKGRHWKTTSDEYDRLLADGRIVFGKTGRAKPQFKRFLKDAEAKGSTPTTWWDDCGTTTEGTKELESVMGEKVFDNPKPTKLLERVLTLTADRKALVLDSFAGSGTTAHAVLKMNAADGGSRRCILVEMEPKIATGVTAERLRRVIDGYGPADKLTPGTGGGFRYCTLGNPLTDENGDVHPDVSFADLAHHVYFKETGRPLPRRPDPDCPHVGDFAGVAYFLLFNGVLGDRRPDRGNVLTHDVLDLLMSCPGWAAAEKRVVYGDANPLDGSARLTAENVKFEQIPYDLNRAGEVP